MTRNARIDPSGERGFALVTVIAVMAVVMLFSVGAFATVNGDVLGSGEDVTTKQAGERRRGRRRRLPRASSPTTPPRGRSARPAAPRSTTRGPAAPPPAGTKWATVPGSTNQYAIELLPARGSGYTKCDTDPDKVRRR